MHDKQSHGDGLSMKSLRPFSLMLFITAIILVLATNSLIAQSQPETFQTRLNKSLLLVHQAESAGATPEEVGELTQLLNKALEIDDAIHQIAPSDQQRRTQLDVQLKDVFDTLENRAVQLETSASQRTLTTKVVAYASAGFAALALTGAYILGLAFWGKYRIKRTLRMRISPK